MPQIFIHLPQKLLLQSPPGGAASSSKGTAALSKAERIAGREREKERVRSLQRSRKRLAAIEEELGEREEELEGLSSQLAEPHVYRDGEAVRRIEGSRAVLKTAIDEGYAEWERVAAEIESLEQPTEE